MEAQANPRSVRWCDWEGNPVSWAGFFWSFGEEHLLKFLVFPGLVIPVSSSVSRWPISYSAKTVSVCFGSEDCLGRQNLS